jgi:hypothetical protein
MVVNSTDFKYRIKYLLNLGEYVMTEDGLKEVSTFIVQPEIFKDIEKATSELRRTVLNNPKIEFAHVQIKGQLNGNTWHRVVFIKRGSTNLEACIGLRGEIWELFNKAIPVQAAS